MAKDRCKENIDILQRNIDNLPPSEVLAEDRAIHEELRKYCLLPDKICHAVTLLNNAKPHLQSIKRKLGVSNSYYLKISTQVVGNALSDIIAEVYEAQSIFSADKDDPNAKLAAILGIPHVKSVLEEAWKATKIMDGFDMESEYKNGRYNENHSILKELCDTFSVSTSTNPIKPPKTPPTPKKPEPPKSKGINKNVLALIFGVIGLAIGTANSGWDAGQVIGFAIGCAIGGFIIGAILGY